MMLLTQCLCCLNSGRVVIEHHKCLASLTQTERYPSNDHPSVSDMHHDLMSAQRFSPFPLLLLLFAHFAAAPKVRVMRVDTAPCGLIMSKCLRGEMRKYPCWRVRGASLHAGSLCPLQSLSCRPAQWPCCCHSVQAHGWPTYTLCPQTGGRLAVSAAVVRRSAETAQSCTRSHFRPQMRSKL